MNDPKIPLEPGSEEWQARAVEYDNQMLALIHEHGWALQGVFPTSEDDDPPVPFTYTVGASLTRSSGDDEQPDPEIVVYGLPHQIAGAVLNDLVRQHRDGTRTLTPNGRYDDVLVGFDVVLVEVPDDMIDEVFRTSRRIVGPLIGQRPPGLQLVWPDAQGNFPWDDGYEQQYKVIPLLGTYTPGVKA